MAINYHLFENVTSLPNFTHLLIYKQRQQFIPNFTPSKHISKHQTTLT